MRSMLACAFLLTVLQQAPATAQPTAADQKAVEAWLSRYSTSLNQGDLDAFGRLWVEGADWAPPDAPQISGREAILASARATFEKHAVSHRFTAQRFRLGDGFAVAVVAAAERHTPKSGGTALEQGLKGVILLRRDGDGAWRGTHFIWNRDAPAAH